MKTIDLIGYWREPGAKTAKKLRKEGNVPCVMYGKGANYHFYVPIILFRELVYTPEVCFVNMDIEGEEHLCILQDTSFHPVSDLIIHADFLELQDDKEVKMEIPVHYTGTSIGVAKGGKLVPKLRKVKVKGLPANLPDFIEVDVTELDLGKSVKVATLKPEGFAVLNLDVVTIATIEIPRALKSQKTQAEK